MLNLLGTIGANALSFPGIFGVALGMTTRNLFLGAFLGATVGILETQIFASFRFAEVEALELSVAIVVGVLAGLVGTGLRIKGTTV